MNSKTKNAGFTLIELVVVIAITGIILPSLFTIIFTLLRLQIQLTQIQRLKEVGDYASNNMITTIRTNAKRVATDCLDDSRFNRILETTSSSIMFEDRFGNCFGYYIYDNKLASISAALDPQSYYSTYLINNTDSDFEITVDSSQSSMEVVSNKLAKIKLNLKYQPKVDYLQVQSLGYQFYSYIRN